MKKEKINLFKIFVISILSILFINLAIKSISHSQDIPSPTVGTPVVHESPNNLFSSRAISEEAPFESPVLEHSGNERLYTIRIGQTSPASGTLFNTEAVAWMSAYNVYTTQLYMIQLNFRLNELRTAARLRISSLELQLETEHRVAEIRINDLNSQLILEREISNELRTGTIPVSERRHFRKRIIYIAVGTAIIVAALSTSITYSIVSNH